MPLDFQDFPQGAEDQCAEGCQAHPEFLTFLLGFFQQGFRL